METEETAAMVVVVEEATEEIAPLEREEMVAKAAIASMEKVGMVETEEMDQKVVVRAEVEAKEPMETEKMAKMGYEPDKEYQ